MHVRDLTGNEFPLQATTVNEYELNGNMSITATIYPSKVNQAFIRDITEMWTLVDHDGVEHKIIYVKRKGKGASLYVEVKGLPLFFDVLDTLRIYEEYNEHMTAQLAFSRIFEDTGFDFILADSFPAVQWEGFGGGESRLETFKRALERYGAEFRIQGNIVYLHKQIGRDTQFQYRHRLNASNITQEIDASELWTFARGYGDYEDGGEDGGGGGWQEAKLIREYTSPIAQIIGIRHAPPIKDGRIKDEQTMDEALKRLVDESLKISVSADIHLLRKQGYAFAQPELGDRVFLIDERIGLNTEVRVVDISITRNWKGEVIDLKLTFGTPGLVKRYQSNLKTSIQNITDVTEGRKKLPLTALDNAVIQATRDLQNVLTELVTPPNGGLMAVDKQDPNKIVVFNSAGIGISDDGGATFKTTIDASGVTVKDGSFYLEDDTSDTKYSIVPKTNLLGDHSFEMVERTGSINPTYGDFAVKQQIDSYRRWRTVGSPRLLSAHQTDWIQISLFYHGLQAIVVSSTNYVEQHFPYIPGKTYAVSAYFTGSSRSPDGGYPRIEVRLEDGIYGNVRQTWSKSFDRVYPEQDLVRYSLTFNVPADADNTLGGDIVVVSIKSAGGWVVADGVQVVEGNNPVLYDPENGLWNVLNGVKGFEFNSIDVKGEINSVYVNRIWGNANNEKIEASTVRLSSGKMYSGEGSLWWGSGYAGKGLYLHDGSGWIKIK